MTIDRRSLIVSGGAALASASVAAGQSQPAAGVDGSKSAALFLKDDDGLAPATFDRLSLEWHQARAKALQAHLAENGFAGVWLSDPMNIIYFTGLFFTTTERPFSVFLPADRLATVWFHPGLDRDLVRSWWSTDADYYFDFQHADGAYPNEGKVQQGAKVDLFEWVMKGLKKRGYDGKRLATDKDLSPRQLAKAGNVFLKDTKFESIDEHCEKLRMVKSPEELALWRRAYRVFDETHAFARD
ncbi:MAG TPA: aminopeptidase P family N-terminal domain-containing protein, partial [Thermoanaerobaculia bacterium]